MSEQDERLRDAFAQLLAMGSKGAVPAEAVWQRQGLDQLKPAPPPDDMTYSRVFPNDSKILPLELNRPQGYEGSDVHAPMPQVRSADPTLDFPVREPPPPQGLPFHGKGEVVGEYKLPKKDKKKKDKR